MQTKPAIFFLTVFLTVLLFSTLIHPAFATTIFSDGFESGNFNAWTGTEQSSGTIVVSSDYAHHGSYSAKSSITGSNGYASCYKDITSQTTIYIRAYVYITAGTFASGTQVSFISPRDVPDGITPCYVGVANANRQLWLRYRHSATNYDVYSATTLSTNTWYCIELKYVKSSTNGEYRVWLNGNEVTDLTQTGKNTDADVTRVRVGPRYTSEITNFVGYFDCVVVADTYIGPEAAGQEYSFTLTETVKPTSTLNIQQEHTYTFTGTIIQSSILSYSVEGIQEFIETLTQTVTSSGTTYYWMELSYALTETAKPTATHRYGLEGTFTLTQTVTPTETCIILQEQLYTFTQTTTLQTILTYAAELAEVFVVNIETVNPQANVYYWIEEFITPLDWSMVAIGLAMVAFIIAAAAIALR
jgi:hypothetical protein